MPGPVLTGARGLSFLCAPGPRPPLLGCDAHSHRGPHLGLSPHSPRGGSPCADTQQTGGRPKTSACLQVRVTRTLRQPPPPRSGDLLMGRLRDGETASCRVTPSPASTPGRSLGRPKRSSFPSLRPEIRHSRPGTVTPPTAQRVPPLPGGQSSEVLDSATGRPRQPHTGPGASGWGSKRNTFFSGQKL